MFYQLFATPAVKTPSLDATPNLLKVVLLGDLSLKSLISGITPSTIGLEFVSVPVVNQKVQIWDLAGQDKFRAITSTYYKGTHAVVLLASSQDALQEQYRKIADSCNNFSVILATPEGVTLDTSSLKIDAVFPVNSSNCNAQRLASFAVETVESKNAEQAASSANVRKTTM